MRDRQPEQNRYKSRAEIAADSINHLTWYLELVFSPETIERQS